MDKPVSEEVVILQLKVLVKNNFTSHCVRIHLFGIVFFALRRERRISNSYSWPKPCFRNLE